MELALMFGTRSSPGIFCDLLSLFVSCVALLVGIAPYLVLQHLDDVLAVGSGRQVNPVDRFHEVFLEEAAKVGLRADLSDNRDKNQEPDTKVMALGVSYDTEKWEWGFSEGRLAIILDGLRRVEGGERLTLEEMESPVGKLNSISFLVEGGRFYLDGFYRATVGVRSSKLPVAWVGCL